MYTSLIITSYGFGKGAVLILKSSFQTGESTIVEHQNQFRSDPSNLFLKRLYRQQVNAGQSTHFFPHSPTTQTSNQIKQHPMNWLAHIFLSEDNVEYQHGNLLADLLKGRSWEHASEAFNAGLKTHQAIDLFTDSHSLVLKSQSRLGERGHLKGVVIDIVYDHLLASNWYAFSNISYDDFIVRFNRESTAILSNDPESAQAFLRRLIASGHLLEYSSFSAVEKALHRIDGRLSQRVLKHESASDYLPMAKIKLNNIEEDFLAFMPQLIRHFKGLSKVSFDSHWLK